MSTFNSFLLFPDLASVDGCITSVSRIPNSMEVFWINKDGSVHGAFWYEGSIWGNYELAPAGSASTNGSITVVSRIPNSMEVFWVGQNGSIQDAYWYEGANWQRFELAPAGSASTNGSITVVSRIPNSLEVFWVGQNGSVQDAYWYEGAKWQRFELAPAGSASTNGSITVVSRIPNSLEVFWVGQNGSVQDAYWYEGAKWQRFELAPAGSASTNGSITVVSRIPNSLEVFWVGQNGSVEDAYWYEGASWQRFELAPAGSASTNGSITVVSRIPSSMEVFWVGQNGSVQDAYWYEGSNWGRYELFPNASASTNGSITVVSRIPVSMELWFISQNGSIQDGYWYDNSNITLHQNVVTEGIDAFGGWVEVTINRNGNVRFKGHCHDSGAESYDFNIRTIVHSDSPIVLALQKSGSVEGTIHSGLFDAPRRDFDWDETTFNPNVAASFDDIIKNIKMDVYSSDSGDISSVLEDIANFAIKWIAGSILLMNPLTGIIIFIGVEIGSIATGAGFAGGARVIGNILWCAGPFGTLYAIAAEGIAKLGENERKLTDNEYNFANTNIFKGMLPSKDDIILTDTIGGNDRAFTMPRFDGKITVNMGEDGFKDPLNYRLDKGWQKGQVFIHELTHAWQIKNTHWGLSLMASALASKVCEIGGGDPYNFGTDATKPFGDFNLEQQAHIVDAWFASCVKDSTGNIIDNISSPWYHYIEGNIRVGQPS